MTTPFNINLPFSVEKRINFADSKICSIFAINININYSNMSTAVASTEKSQMAFRFRNDLVGVMKREAKKENRSLNNFVENLLVNYFSVDDEIPNATTIAAIEEARAGKYAGIIDTSSMEAFIKSSEE